MKIDKEILKAWKKELEEANLTVVAKDARVNYRTLVSALKTGYAISRTITKINKYVLKKKQDRTKLLESLETD